MPSFSGLAHGGMHSSYSSGGKSSYGSGGYSGAGAMSIEVDGKRVSLMALAASDQKCEAQSLASPK